MNYSILINTCDKFEDCWDPFFKLWSLYWKDCKGTVYLNTEYKDYSFPNLDIISVKGCSTHGIPKNKRATWSQCLKWAIEIMDTELILYLQEDYFLNGKVKNEMLEHYLKYMADHPEIPCIQLTTDGIPVREIYDKKEHLHYSNPKHFSYVSCQASIWRKDILTKLIREHESAWNFEWWGSKRAYYLGIKFLTLNHDWLKDGNDIIPYIKTGVIGGKWYHPVVDLFNKHGIQIDFSRRGFFDRNRKKPFMEKIKFKKNMYRLKSMWEIFNLKYKLRKLR